MGQLYNMLYPNRKNILTHEYIAIDYANFIPILPLLYRHFFNTTFTTINHPSILIELFISNWTSIGQYIQHSIKIASAISIPFPLGLVIFAELGYFLEKEIKLKIKLKDIEKLKCNIYQELFVNYNKNKENDIKKLQEDFKIFKAFIKVIKTKICDKCEKRKLDPIEISNIKLFQPKLIEKEVNIAMNHYNKTSPMLHDFSNKVLNFIQKEILEYILNNTHTK